ncbi:hypothetical protein B0H14DRAFT_3532682 [Mycena olivaceomarginata]|nr:hypothetical protein B0H14DRAFT_3532682 [Mycena olivaceomarginata]
MSTPPPTTVHPACLDVGPVPRLIDSTAAQHTPVPRPRLSSADCACTLPISQLRCALYKTQARRYDQGCTSPVPVPVPTTRLHSRLCRPLWATAFSPIPCSSSLSFTPSSSPSTSPIPERKPCASIVQQRRVNIRLMRCLPAVCAASPAALIVSPPIPIPPLPPASFRAATARHLPRLPPTMPPVPCRRRCGVTVPLRISASILCPPRTIAPHHTTSSLDPHPLYHLSLRRVLAFSPPA